MQKLAEHEVTQKLTDLDGWSLKEGKLHKTFKFKDFKAAFSFMTHVALHAETADHHPDWYNVYNRVEINLNTHDAGGITEKDFSLAQKIEGVRH